MEAGAVGLAAAFAAGLASFLSPCVLPLVPACVSYVAGQPLRAEAAPLDAHERLAALALSAYFVLGFSAVFVALGASATLLGRLLLQYRYEANIVGGATRAPVVFEGALAVSPRSCVRCSGRFRRACERADPGNGSYRKNESCV